jgi:flagellin
VSLQAGIDRANNLLDVTQTAGQQITSVLMQMREKAMAATTGGLSATQIASYAAEFTQLRTTIDNIANSAVFNGVTLVGTGAAAQSVITNDAGGTPMTLAVSNWLVAGLGPASTTFTNAATATTAVTEIDTALGTLNSALATFGAQSKALDAQKIFLSKLADTVEKGIGQLVDADLGRESARLQALQVKQQLGTQAVSIANQAPQFILSLFGNR